MTTPDLVDPKNLDTEGSLHSKRPIPKLQKLNLGIPRAAKTPVKKKNFTIDAQPMEQLKPINKFISQNLQQETS